MVFLTIDIDDALAKEYFDYAGYKIRDARDPLKQVMHDVIFPAIREQLDTEGMRSGDPWPALNEKYREWKELNYPGEPILRLTGALESELFAYHSYYITRSAIHYEPQSDYGHYHQTGGYVYGRPPQRVILDITGEDEVMIEGIFELWLDELRTFNRRRGAPIETFRPSLPGIDVL